MHRPRRNRESLSDVGGPVALTGPEAERFAWLADALTVEVHGDDSRAHVHGFHSYPAKLHPVIAARLLAGLARPGDTVLDPFCGSGTVLVEARLRGCRAVGNDANPLAVRLARLKIGGLDARARRELMVAADRVVASAEARRASRAGATRRYGPADLALFDPHILLELDGLRSAIEREGAARPALLLVLSSILTKLSRRPGDSANALVARRLASGFALRMFRAKTGELAERAQGYEDLLARRGRASGQDRPTAWEVHEGDARRLAFLPSGSVRAVVTSPPYPGTYDYMSHHADRLRWLGLRRESFESSEIGARRHLSSLPRSEAEARWSADLGRALGEMARALAPDGAIALVIADSTVGREPLFADEVTPRIAVRCGLELVASASQARRHVHRPSERAFSRRPRREHVLVLKARGRSGGS